MYDPMRRTYEDMAALKYKVELNESERTHLKQMASRGETSSRKVKRALVLLKADEGMTDCDIASGLLISASTVVLGTVRGIRLVLGSSLDLDLREADNAWSGRLEWAVGGADASLGSRL